MEVRSRKESLEQMARQTGDPYYEALIERGVIDDDYIHVTEAERLTRAQKKEILMNFKEPSKEELGTWVKIFYNLQDYRKAAREQIRSMTRRAEENGFEVNTAFNEQIIQNAVILEANLHDILAILVADDPVGRWLLRVTGIADVLAANLLSAFDVRGRQYSSQFISYAGMNDQNRPWLGTDKSKALINDVLAMERDAQRRQKIVTYIKDNDIACDWEAAVEQTTDELWEKYTGMDSKFKPKPNSRVPLTNDLVEEIAARSQWSYDYLRTSAYDAEKDKWDKKKLVKAVSKVPYNRSVKTLMYKVGLSFMYTSGRPDSLYGRLYAERKAKEIAKNEAGELADAAKHKLETTDIDPKKPSYAIYASGMLPDGHITMRAKRWTEKIFVSHLFEEMYRIEYGEVPPRAYALEHIYGHHTDIAPEVPYDLVPGEPGFETSDSWLRTHEAPSKGKGGIRDYMNR